MVHTLNLKAWDENKEFRRISYHQDIRPANILLDSRTFYLADFGLARVKSVDEKSQANWKLGLDFLGPECLDGNSFVEQSVGRAPDTRPPECTQFEIAAYIDGCRKGVERFRERHKGNAFRSNMNDYYFFTRGDLKPSVVSWAKDVSTETGSVELRKLLELGSFMLRVDPNERLKAEEVRQQLSFLSIRPLFGTVVSALAEYLKMWRSPLLPPPSRSKRHASLRGQM